MDDLDLRYRTIIGAEASDSLLKEHVKLDLLFADKVCGHMAHGHIGGADWGPLRGPAIVGSGSTPQEAALALIRPDTRSKRPKTLRSLAWALEQNLSLLTGAMQHGR